MIICPTETLPGLSCLPDKTAAVQRILSIKKRTSSKGLIMIAANLDQLKPWIKPLNMSKQKLILDSMLNSNSVATTWLVPHRNNISHLLCGNHSTLAIRLTSHPVAREICNKMNSPLVSTSVNITSTKPLLSLNNIPDKLREQVDMIVAGAPGSGRPSKIVHIEEEKVIRDPENI